jgi:hypothetical protein
VPSKTVKLDMEVTWNLDLIALKVVRVGKATMTGLMSSRLDHDVPESQD